MGVEKIIESYDIDDYEVWSDDGWKDIDQVHKTIKHDVWLLETENHFLKCADEHIVIDENYNEVFVEDLKTGDRIITESGIESIKNVKKLDIESEHMYDFSVKSNKHLLFTNGILSHNTTISTVYLLHYMLFNKDKNVAVLANKEKTAIEINRRIQLAYKNLPLWLQQGIKVWKKTGMELENGSILKASTTSPDSISGDSVNLLYMDEFSKVKPHIADDFLTATYPVISSGKTSKIIMTSTPLGMNHFYEFWINAARGYNNFFPIKVGWWEHPDRDDEWKKDVIRDIGVVRFNQEYGCSVYNTNINIRDKITGEVETIKLGELYNRLEVS